MARTITGRVMDLADKLWDREKLFSSKSERVGGFGGIWRDAVTATKQRDGDHFVPNASRGFVISGLSRKAAFKKTKKEFETLFEAAAPVMTLNDSIVMSSVAGAEYRANKVKAANRVRLQNRLKFGHIRQSL